jgi:hypothetical protein
LKPDSPDESKAPATKKNIQRQASEMQRHLPIMEQWRLASDHPWVMRVCYALLLTSNMITTCSIWVRFGLWDSQALFSLAAK